MRNYNLMFYVIIKANFFDCNVMLKVMIKAKFWLSTEGFEPSPFRSGT
jgi:hypothetical protein